MDDTLLARLSTEDDAINALQELYASRASRLVPPAYAFAHVRVPTTGATAWQCLVTLDTTPFGGQSRHTWSATDATKQLAKRRAAAIAGAWVARNQRAPPPPPLSVWSVFSSDEAPLWVAPPPPPSARLDDRVLELERTVRALTARLDRIEATERSHSQ